MNPPRPHSADSLLIVPGARRIAPIPSPRPRFQRGMAGKQNRMHGSGGNRLNDMRFSTRVRKCAGLFLYQAIGKHLPISYSRLGGRAAKRFRGLCARLILDECGADVNVERGAVFSSRVRLGDRSGIGINASIGGRTLIGNDVMMGPECTVYCRNHRFDRTDIAMRGQGFQAEKPVVIEDDVWIGGHVILLPGVRIGRGSVIGAGAVVSRDVPAYAVAAGNPARVVRYRKEEMAHEEADQTDSLRMGGASLPEACRDRGKGIL